MDRITAPGSESLDKAKGSRRTDSGMEKAEDGAPVSACSMSLPILERVAGERRGDSLEAALR